MTAPPQMRSGKRNNWLLLFQSLLIYFVPLDVFVAFITLNLLILGGGRWSRPVGHLKSCSTRPGSERPRLWALPRCFARWETAVMNCHSLERESHNKTDFAVCLWPCFLCSPKNWDCVFWHTFCLLPCLQDLEVAADFSITNGVTCLLEALKKRNHVKVRFLCSARIYLCPQFSGHLRTCLTLFSYT